MNWSCIVPLKKSQFRKSRLKPHLDLEERSRLAESMAQHVIDVLISSKALSEVKLLSEAPMWGVDVPWIPDCGRGLNAELGRAVRLAGETPLLVMLGDLPALTREDVIDMIEQAENGSSIAPDRHDTGTNALALLRPAGFAFAFGAGSFAAHRQRLGSGCRTVRRPGLAFDVDTAADLEAAFAQGLLLNNRRVEG